MKHDRQSLLVLLFVDLCVSYLLCLVLCLPLCLLLGLVLCLERREGIPYERACCTAEQKGVGIWPNGVRRIVVVVCCMLKLKGDEWHKWHGMPWHDWAEMRWDEIHPFIPFVPLYSCVSVWCLSWPEPSLTASNHLKSSLTRNITRIKPSAQASLIQLWIPSFGIPSSWRQLLSITTTQGPLPGPPPRTNLQRPGFHSRCYNVQRVSWTAYAHHCLSSVQAFPTSIPPGIHPYKHSHKHPQHPFPTSISKFHRWVSYPCSFSPLPQKKKQNSMQATSARITHLLITHWLHCHLYLSWLHLDLFFYSPAKRVSKTVTPSFTTHAGKAGLECGLSSRAQSVEVWVSYELIRYNLWDYERYVLVWVCDDRILPRGGFYTISRNYRVILFLFVWSPNDRVVFLLSSAVFLTHIISASFCVCFFFWWVCLSVCFVRAWARSWGLGNGGVVFCGFWILRCAWIGSSLRICGFVDFVHDSV